MNMRINKKSILILILVLAAFLRVWKLGNVPPSASMDEASIGYNAYSVSKIGVDEYGHFPLISQRAYDDWRRSTYLLLVVPFVALLNLNVIAIRLPAVILSILTVWATYHIVLSLFSKRSEFSSNIALLASFLLAMSPWHIYISRLGHESNAYLSFFVLGVMFFLQGIQDKRKILLAIIFFILSMISYYAGQIIIPLLVLGLLCIYRKFFVSIVLSDKKTLLFLFVFMLLLVPILWAIFSPEALIRFQGTSTFKPEAHEKEFAERIERRNKAVESHDIVGTILYNRRLFPVQVFFEGYISHFNFQWLFTNSSGESFKVPHLGLLYMWELPFIIMGIFAFFICRDIDVRAKKTIFLWFFLAPFPASVATQAPHAMRSYAFLPTWQIFTAFGLIFVFNKMRNVKIVGLVAFIAIVIFSLQAFYKNYYIVFPKEQSKSFHYALSKAIPFVLSKENSYDKIVFSNENNLYQSYMVFLYHSRFDPLLYQKQGGTKSGGFAQTHTFDKFEFRPILWDREIIRGNVLYVGNITDFPADITSVFTSSNLDGTPAIRVVSR